MKKIFRIGIIFFTFLLINGCNDKEIIVTEDDFFIGGNIVLMNEHGSPIYDRSGVRVYIENSKYETYTDQMGNWKIYSVPAGIYNIVAEKEGFGYNKFINFDYLGNATSNNFGQTLIASPTYVIDSVSQDVSSQDLLLTIYPSNTANNLRVILIYLGKDEPVKDSIETQQYIRQTQIYSANTSVTESFPNGFFLSEGFNHGDTLHFAVYPGASIVEKYFLPSASKVIYTSGVGSIPKRFTYIIP